MELRTILPAVLCISVACLQAACGAAPRRGPKVTEKVGADAALACAKPTLRYFSVRRRLRTANGRTRARIHGGGKRGGCFYQKGKLGRLNLHPHTDLSRTRTLSLPPARTHAHTLSCTRVHCDERARLVCSPSRADAHTQKEIHSR